MKHYFILFLFFLFTHLFYAQTGTPYTIVISLDGFRHDYLFKGHSRVLDSLATAGVHASSFRPVFPSKTFPNHITILTGLYPINHGVVSNSMYNPENNKKYRMSDAEQVANPEWYKGEFFWETARKNGIITASYFWPGSFLSDESRRPNYSIVYDHYLPYHKRVEGIITWLTLPEEQRPHFLTLYFDATDTYGHDHGPLSDSLFFAVKMVDTEVERLINQLRSINLADSINIIVLSDHGMTPINKSREVSIKPLLDRFKAKAYDTGIFSWIDCEDAKVDSIQYALREFSSDIEVFKPSEMPSYWHYNTHPFFKKLFVLAKPGAELITSNRKMEYENRGNHGYDNYNLDMHGIFIASGPLFWSNYKTGTLNNIDVYPLLCRIYGITPDHKVDGTLDNIEFILKREN